MKIHTFWVTTLRLFGLWFTVILATEVLIVTAAQCNDISMDNTYFSLLLFELLIMFLVIVFLIVSPERIIRLLKLSQKYNEENINIDIPIHKLCSLLLIAIGIFTMMDCIPSLINLAYDAIAITNFIKERGAIAQFMPILVKMIVVYVLIFQHHAISNWIFKSTDEKSNEF